MHRLMTGYAVTFNPAWDYLFENRYNSISYENNGCLWDLIRYIHLTPLQAKVVRDIEELDQYPWTGHSAILGHRKNALVPEVRDQKSEVGNQRAAEGNQAGPNSPKGSNKNPEDSVNPVCPVAPADGTGVKEKPLAEKTIEDVLLHFGETKKVAWRRYRDFIMKGIDQGTREDIQGGGLVRSAGGERAWLLGRKEEEREKGDATILGSEDFVNTILRDAEQEFENASKKRLSLEELMCVVAKATEVSVEELLSPSRKRSVAHARAIVTYAAIQNLGYRGTEIAKALSLSPPSVSQNIDKGKVFLDRNEELKIGLSIT